jgi:Protein of unknown function (DUF2934)
MSPQMTREMTKKTGSTERRNHEPDPRAIELLAHEHWMDRGCPDGSPEVDWIWAEDELRKRMGPMSQAA